MRLKLTWNGLRWRSMPFAGRSGEIRRRRSSSCRRGSSMSSSDRGRLAKGRFGAIGVLIAAGLALGACSVQTLYGPSNFTEVSAVQANLTRISVAEVTDRVGQQ